MCLVTCPHGTSRFGSLWWTDLATVVWAEDADAEDAAVAADAEEGR